MGTFNPPPGTDDILPDSVYIWQYVEKIAAQTFSLYGYSEIRTPVFEYTELFSKGIGEQTEVVQKEMYTFEDKGGRSLTLRPEGTAGIIRALADLSQQGAEPRVFYIGPMFRGERPAAGRKRQFHQIGVENISQPSPELDAEAVLMLMDFVKRLGIDRARLKVNTRGVPEDLPSAAEKLRAILVPRIDLFCEECKKRLERNVWRILDCKNSKCIDSLKDLSVENFFSERSLSYLDKVLNILSREGISFERDSKLVRGLDYYVHTVFELVHDGLGAQNSIAGGGRYQILPPGGKKHICGVGFACGQERLIMALQSEKKEQFISKTAIDVFLISMGEEARQMNFTLAGELRKKGLRVIADYNDRSMKSAMRAADKSGAKFLIIRGENEIRNSSLILKDMCSGSQSEISVQKIVEQISSALTLESKI